MTNKPMLRVERELLESFRQHLIETGHIEKFGAALFQILNVDKPAAQHQGEPVACLVRNRNLLTQASIAVDGKDHFGVWSAWEPCSIEYGRAVTDPLRNDPVCYEMELLFKEQLAPVAVVMPERMYSDSLPSWAEEQKLVRGWNACLDEVSRLNGVKP